MDSGDGDRDCMDWTQAKGRVETRHGGGEQPREPGWLDTRTTKPETGSSRPKKKGNKKSPGS